MSLRHAPLEFTGGNGEEGAAQAVGLLIQGDGAAALGGAASGLESAGAAAYHDDVGRLADGLDLHVALEADGGVDGAAELGQAAEDAADALLGTCTGADVLAAALAQLVGELRVGDALATELHDVGVAALEQGDGGSHGVVAGIDNGLGEVLAGLFTYVGHAGLAGVAGREDVIQRLVAGRVDVEGVNSALVEHVEYLHALLDGASAGEAVVEADTIGYREVGADDEGADGVHGLHGETAAVLEASAVLVGAVVPYLAHELIHEVAGVGMDLDAVKAHAHGVEGGDFPVLRGYSSISSMVSARQIMSGL